MMNIKKTTENHLAIFQREVEKWIDIFGLLEWEVIFKRDDLGPHRAALSPNVEGRSAVFILCDKWNDVNAKLNKAQLQFLARHEVCELLLSDLHWMATCRYVQPEEINSARHTIIGRWMKYMSRKEKNG